MVLHTLSPPPEHSLQGQGDGQKKTRMDTIPLRHLPTRESPGKDLLCFFIKVWQNLHGHVANFFLKLPTADSLSKECLYLSTGVSHRAK